MYSIPTARGRYAVPKWGWGGGVGAGGDMIKEGVLTGDISLSGELEDWIIINWGKG